MIDDSNKKWLKFAIWAVLYSLWVMWTGNFWLILGIAVIYDIYISRFIPWDYYKRKRNGKTPPKWLEWVDAIVFALIAVGFINTYFFQNYKIPTPSLEKTLLVGDHLFVSKVSYGPRNPITPLSFPLTQSTMPIINTKSYFEWPQWKYKRLKGFGSVQHDDIVVFNFPGGDTVPAKVTNPDYEQLVNEVGREKIWNDKNTFGEVSWRPIDRRDNYVKRCVGLPGDSLKIIDNQLYVNGVAQKHHVGIQFNYGVNTQGMQINEQVFKDLNIRKEDRHYNGDMYLMPLTDEKVNKLKALSIVKGISQYNIPKGEWESSIYPRDRRYPWNQSNFGPIWIPKKGATVSINIDNLPLFRRIIQTYENNTLLVKDSAIYINGALATSYTFKMDYFFMMGDNRHNSADSRYWGFVPEDHIVGKPILVWLSLDEDGTFPFNIRWRRFFKMVDTNE